MDLTGINRVTAPASFDADKIAKSKQTEEEKIGQLAEQFEAVMLRQILHDAQKTVIKSDLTSDSVSSDIYRDMVGSQMADAISQSGSFGFAAALKSQLAHQVLHTQPDLNDPNE